MSHTTKLSSGNHAIHDGDFGGDIIFVIGDTQHYILSSDVKEIVAEMIRSEKINRIEQMETAELLGLPSRS